MKDFFPLDSHIVLRLLHMQGCHLAFFEGQIFFNLAKQKPLGLF